MLKITRRALEEVRVYENSVHYEELKERCYEELICTLSKKLKKPEDINVYGYLYKVALNTAKNYFMKIENKDAKGSFYQFVSIDSTVTQKEDELFLSEVISDKNTMTEDQFYMYCILEKYKEVYGYDWMIEKYFFGKTNVQISQETGISDSFIARTIKNLVNLIKKDCIDFK
ncbi:MAG: hypothetical protein Q4C49_13700 [Bacillota bacterium]|nr:hypothetical protein [Bacillota bacterium]